MEKNSKKTANYYRRRWLVYAVGGLILIGFGVCLVAEAAWMKHETASFWRWIGLGTAGLVVLNSGVSVFGEAILHRTRYERIRHTSTSEP